MKNQWTEEVDRLRKVNKDLLDALRELADWDLHSLCFDGTKAKNAGESLANVRRYARTTIAAAEGREDEKSVVCCIKRRS